MLLFLGFLVLSSSLISQLLSLPFSRRSKKEKSLVNVRVEVYITAVNTVYDLLFQSPLCYFGFAEFTAKMNDLMTKLFSSYVKLKKPSGKDMECEEEDDTDEGKFSFSPEDEQNLSGSFQEVEDFKTLMENREVSEAFMEGSSCVDRTPTSITNGHHERIFAGYREELKRDYLLSKSQVPRAKQRGHREDDVRIWVEMNPKMDLKMEEIEHGCSSKWIGIEANVANAGSFIDLALPDLMLCPFLLSCSGYSSHG